MMSNLKKIPLVLLTLFILAACSNPQADPVAENQAAVPQATESDAVAEEVSENPYASPYGTGLNCDLLQQEKNRQQCEGQMNDIIGTMLEAEIVRSFNVARCQELRGEVASSCTARLTETGVQGPVTDEEIALFDEFVRGTFSVPDENADSTVTLYPSYDPTKCAQLKTPGYQAYCEKQINQRMDQNKFEQIIQSNDVKGCDRLNGEETIARCKQFFGLDVQPIETNDPANF